ncbi:MAG: glycosyltransferase [Bacteroidales bacterium]|nr:glycosyltransferase [Bacteroidales bacterium]
MRILQVCNKPPYPPRDGGSLAMFNLAYSLKNLGHQVSVLTMFTRKHRLTAGQSQEFSQIMEVHSVFVDTTPGLFRIITNLAFSDKPYHVERFFSEAFETELCRILKTSPFDVVQLEGLYLTDYIPAIRKNTNALIALRAHNVEHEIWERMAQGETGIFRKAFFRILAKRIKHYEQQVINQYDMLVPITTRDLDHFRAMGNTRPAHVCNAGVDIDTGTGNGAMQAEQLPSTTTSLFFIGSLDWIPNQEGLLWFVKKVFPLIHHQFPAVKFHIAGRNAPTSLQNSLNYPGIVFHGEVPDARIFAAKHQISIAPCFSGSGMRVKIIESMALGIPVVTTTIGAEGLNAIHNENIIIADGAADFFRHIERLIEFPELCRSIGDHAKNFAAHNFDNKILAANLVGFYEKHLK